MAVGPTGSSRGKVGGTEVVELPQYYLWVLGVVVLSEGVVILQPIFQLFKLPVVGPTDDVCRLDLLINHGLCCVSICIIDSVGIQPISLGDCQSSLIDESRVMAQ